MTTYFVTSATGNVSTQVVKGLLDRGGEKVVAGVRDPKKATHLSEAGAEVVSFDFDQPETFEGIFKKAGVDRLFLLTPGVEKFVHYVESVTNAAKNSGISFILRFSAFGADPKMAGLAGEHGKSEKILADSGIDWAVIRPTFFMDNFVMLQADAIISQGAFYGASGEGKTSYISTGDLAAVATEILKNPEKHNGKAYELTGGEALSDAQIAELISNTIDKKVQFVNLDPEQYKQGLAQMQIPDWLIQDLATFESVKAAGYAEAISPAVSEILGRKPEIFADFIKQHRARFV